MMRTIISIISFLAVLSSAVAVTWYVAPDGDDGAAGTSWGTALLTLGTGVSKASAPDTVLVSNGVYVFPAQVTINKGITLQSVNGRDVTILNGNFPVTENRCFVITHSDAVLDGFTITNSAANIYGGGIWMTAGTVQNCTISGNRATNIPSGGYGGGVRITAGVLSNCTIIGNTASWLGGGVSIGGGAVYDCTITGNRTTSAADGDGGGVHITAGLLSDCTVSENTVAWYGSGVYLGGAGALVKNCIISSNTATARGGAVYFGNGTVEDSMIIDNTSADYGGGVDFWFHASGMVSNCVISGNTCAKGGGIYMYGGNGSCFVENCLIVSNTADSGGGLYVNGDAPDESLKNCRISANLARTSQGGGVCSGNSAHPIFVNCLITGNRATNSHGGGLCVGPVVIENCTIVSNSCRMDNGYVGGGMRSSINGTVIVNSIIYHNSAGSASASNYTVYIAPACFTNCCLAPAVSGGSAAYSTNNITDDPMFVDTLNRNFRLLRDSPCINTGVNQDWMTNAVDMNNWSRIDSGTVDIGCYEYVEEGSIITFY